MATVPLITTLTNAWQDTIAAGIFHCFATTHEHNLDASGPKAAPSPQVAETDGLDVSKGSQPKVTPDTCTLPHMCKLVKATCSLCPCLTCSSQFRLTNPLMLQQSCACSIESNISGAEDQQAEKRSVRRSASRLARA